MSVSAWEPDPTGRHQYRWWDGEGWTDQVADDGVQTVDPVSAAEARLPHDALPSMPPPSSPSDGQPGDTHPSGVPDPLTMLASKGQRFGAFLLDLALVVFTLGIGYLIWMLIVWARGQTPAKQVLRMRVVRLDQRQAASWPLMFVRQFLLGAVVWAVDFAIGSATGVTVLGLLWLLANAISLLVSNRHQALWDRIVKTVVVTDQDRVFAPSR